MQLWNRHVLGNKLRNVIAKFDAITENVIEGLARESRSQNSDEPDETGPAIVLVLGAKDYAVRASYTLVTFFEPAA